MPSDKNRANSPEVVPVLLLTEEELSNLFGGSIVSVPSESKIYPSTGHNTAPGSPSHGRSRTGS